MGEEGLGLKPGLAELKLEPGIHRFVKLFESNFNYLSRDGDVEPLVDTPHTAARKSDKIRQIVNEHTSAESQKTVESILDQVTEDNLLKPEHNIHVKCAKMEIYRSRFCHRWTSCCST